MRIRPDFWIGDNRICWLCVLMESFGKTNCLEHAPALMSGMASVFGAPALIDARQAIFNMRQMSLAFVTTHSIKHAVALYNEHHYQRHTTGPYRIDAETLTFEQTDPFEDPLICRAREYLSRPMDHEMHANSLADPSAPMVAQIGDPRGGARIPIGPIRVPLSARRTHDLSRTPKGAIKIPIADLRQIAQGMDEHDRLAPDRRRGNWEQRLQGLSVMKPDRGRGLSETDEIDLEGAKHLIGLPGSGKTTILMLIAVWLGRRGYKTMLAFPSIEVARQYMADLSFHGIRVGMLVGQNPTTRREHANRIAEAISASGGQGGFAQSIPGADSFAENCVLPAFATGSVDAWRFGYAPCDELLQGQDKNGRMRKRLCPVWTMCGRNKAPRDLLSADIWVGHVLSMDTQIPAHAMDEKVRYFELVARTFDVMIFDEADMVQSHLDSYGAAVMKISGAADSIHREIQTQIHDRFAGGENHRLLDRNIELYSRDLAEFGNHNYTLVSVVQNVDSNIRERFADQLLTTSRIISELLDNLTRRPSRRDDMEETEIRHGFTVARAFTDFWDTAAYAAFYDRTGADRSGWAKGDLCARILAVERQQLDEARSKLIDHFRRYLAENLNQRRDQVMADISQVFLAVCFQGKKQPGNAPDAIRLLVSITFMILGYQRIVPGTRQMVADGLIRDPIMKATATPELRRFIPENIMGSLSGVKYSMMAARNTGRGARNVELSYITFVGAPRMLMRRFHRLLEADRSQPGPAVLMTSATSFLEASPAYHIDTGPHYLLRPHSEHSDRAQKPREELVKDRDETRYVFKWIAVAARWIDPIARKGPLVPYAEDTEKLTLAALEKTFESARARRVGEAVERKLQESAPQDVTDLLPYLQARAETVTASAKGVLDIRGRQEAEAMRRIIEDQRKRILARKEEVKRNEAQLTLGFDKMELLQLEEERKDWDKRLAAIGREVDEEPARILKSYEVQAHRVEPIGVVYLWPISG